MRRYSDRPTMHTLTEINVTPLLDLAFVLLIIFIITTPLMENSVNLVVPTSAQANQSVNLAETQTISVDKDEHPLAEQRTNGCRYLGRTIDRFAQRETGRAGYRSSGQILERPTVHRGDGYSPESADHESWGGDSPG